MYFWQDHELTVALMCYDLISIVGKFETVPARPINLVEASPGSEATSLLYNV